VPEVEDDVEVEINRDDTAHRHLSARRAPAASTSTRPIPRCAHAHCRAASSRRARTNARRSRTSETAMKILKARLLERPSRRRSARCASPGRARRGGLGQPDPLVRPCTPTRWS
jgi:hypothetical protein